MTSSAEPVTGPAIIMKPYTPDPNGRGRRRARLLVVVLVSIFCLVYGVVFAALAPYLMLPLIAPLPVLALIVIWALPETRTAPTRTMVVLTFAFFIGLVMWPNYIAFAPPGLPWITMVRLTGFPLFITLLICVSVSQDFRSRLATALNATPVLWKMLVAFAVLQLISIGFSRQPGQSIDKFIVAQVSWTAMFFLSVYVFLRPGRVERMAGMFWVMAILVGLIGIQEWRHAGVLWVGHIPKLLQIPDPAVANALATHVRSADGTYRTQSTFSTSLGLAEYVALTLPFVVQFLFGRYGWPVRLAAAISIPFLLFIVYITNSRLGVVGCMMTLFLYPLIWAVLRWRRDRQSLVAPAMVLAVPVAIVITGFLTLTWPRLHNLVLGNGAQQYSTIARQDQLGMAIPKLLKHPWGYGISMGPEAVGFVSISGIQTLDSYYITIAIEYGVIGFILYYGFFITSIIYATRYTLKYTGPIREYSFLIPLSIALSNFFVVKSVFSQQDNHPIIFMYLGMMVALAARIKSEAVAPMPPVDAHDQVRSAASAPGGRRALFAGSNPRKTT